MIFGRPNPRGSHVLCVAFLLLLRVPSAVFPIAFNIHGDSPASFLAESGPQEHCRFATVCIDAPACRRRKLQSSSSMPSNQTIRNPRRRWCTPGSDDTDTYASSWRHHLYWRSWATAATSQPLHDKKVPPQIESCCHRVGPQKQHTLHSPRITLEPSLTAAKLHAKLTRTNTHTHTHNHTHTHTHDGKLELVWFRRRPDLMNNGILAPPYAISSEGQTFEWNIQDNQCTATLIDYVTSIVQVRGQGVLGPYPDV